MTFNLAENSNNLPFYALQTLSSWPENVPFNIPINSTHEQIFNYFKCLRRASLVSINSLMSEIDLYFIANIFPTDLVMVIEPGFDRQKALYFFSRLPQDTKLFLNGHYAPELLNLLPNHSHLFLQKNVLQITYNIASYLPDICTINLPEDVTAFQFRNLSIHLKPNQHLILAEHAENHFLNDDEQETLLEVLSQQNVNQHLVLEEQAENQFLNDDEHEALLEVLSQQKHSITEIEVIYSLTQLSKVRENLSSLAGLILVPSPIGQENSLLMSVALAQSLSIERLQHLLISFMSRNNNMLVRNIGSLKYTQLLEAVREKNVKDLLVLTVLSQLLQRDIYVLTQFNLHIYELNMSQNFKGSPLYLMCDCYSTFHYYNRNSMLPEDSIRQGVMAGYPEANITRHRFH